MSNQQIVVEDNFSLERRRLTRRPCEILPQADFLLIHLIKSHVPGIPTGASLLANPNQPVQRLSNGDRSELLIVRLAPDLLIETATRLGLFRTAAELLFRQPSTPLTGDRRLRNTVETMADELAQADPGWREVIRSLANQLTVQLLRNHINVQRSAQIELSRVGMVDRRLRRAIEFMHDNCGRELTLSEIAGAAYLSEFHFARLFKKITSVSPHTYLASLRIERARRLLAETPLPLSEVG
ncbi:MAG TPA: helix-turn-helix domain-containing protein, partial [Blastocatellia bacterium]|nr:helix-turn-helix domain-containing protein [Blastocatellia bacterium]